MYLAKVSVNFRLQLYICHNMKQLLFKKATEVTAARRNIRTKKGKMDNRAKE
jgi:hypothetical protein